MNADCSVCGQPWDWGGHAKCADRARASTSPGGNESSQPLGPQPEQGTPPPGEEPSDTVPREAVEALERCESVINTNISSMDADGFSPNPWDVEAVGLARDALAKLRASGPPGAEDG